MIDKQKRAMRFDLIYFESEGCCERPVFVGRDNIIGGGVVVYWEYSLDSHAESPGSNLTIAAALLSFSKAIYHIAALDPGV